MTYIVQCDMILLHMNAGLDPSQRFITPERGVELFALQAQVLPDIKAEILTLSGGNVGVFNAIIMRMGDAISEDPDQKTTVSRIREVLGVPEDPSALPGWKSAFWDAFKQEQKARQTAD